MSYKDKKLRENTLRNAFNELLIVAFDKPILSITNRRSVVASIHLGGSVRHKQTREQQSFSQNYQQVYQGLCNAFYEKFSGNIETTEKLKHAICTISSLAAWAGSNTNRTGEIFEKFAEEMVPEDSIINPSLSTIDVIERELHKELGVEKSFDFLTIPLEQFNKKYNGR